MEGVPGVIHPLVRENIEIVHPDMSVPVSSGVSVEQPHVVEELVGHDTHGVGVRRVEAGEDPQSAGQAGQGAGPDVGVGSVEGAVTGAAGTIPAVRNEKPPA